MALIQRITHTALNIFSSSNCGLCDRPTHDLLCHDCQAQCLSCEYTHPQQFWHPPLPVFAWGQYREGIKRGIAALKYNNQPELALLFGQWLGAAWLRSPLAYSSNHPTGPVMGQRPPRRALVVIPVPANEAKKKRRGYDQAELMAQAFCRTTRLPLDRHRVVRTEDTVPMHGLSLKERQRNVQGKFRLHPHFERRLKRQGRQRRKGRQKNEPAILLLDDIHTSGATLSAIAHLFRQHHMSVYGAVALAKAGTEQDRAK